MRDNIEFWASLVLAIVVAFVVAIVVPGNPDKKVVWAIEYGALVITFLFGFMVLAAIASGKIDISSLLEEKGSPDGGASMSRFQLPIFRRKSPWASSLCWASVLAPTPSARGSKAAAAMTAAAMTAAAAMGTDRLHLQAAR